jgi:hypothetical protein
MPARLPPEAGTGLPGVRTLAAWSQGGYARGRGDAGRRSTRRARRGRPHKPGCCSWALERGLTQRSGGPR